MVKGSRKQLLAFVIIILVLTDLVSVVLGLLNQVNTILIVRGVFLFVLLALFVFERNKIFFVLLQAWIIVSTAGGILVLLGMLLQYIGSPSEYMVQWSRFVIGLLNAGIGLYLILNIDDAIVGLAVDEEGQ